MKHETNTLHVLIFMFSVYSPDSKKEVPVTRSIMEVSDEADAKLFR
jgi:hypothetical protein